MKLMKTRSFYPLFLTQFLGALNDNLLKNAIVIAVTVHTIRVFGFAPEKTVVLAGGIFILPFFLFSAVAGQISDKYDKSHVLQLSKLLEVFVMLFSAGALWFANYELLLVTLFFMGLQSTFFGPAKFSILPQHIHDDKLIAANAYVEMGTFLAILLGTILGGVLITLSQGPVIVAVALLSLAIIGFLTSLLIPKAQAGHPHQKINWNPITTTWHQMRFARKSDIVFTSMIGGSWFWFVGAFILSLLPVLCLHHFHGQEGLITYFLTLFSVGIGLGSVCCEFLVRRFSEIKIILSGLCGMGVALISLSLMFLTEPAIKSMSWMEFTFTSYGFSASAIFIFLAFMSGLYVVPLNTLVQKKSASASRSQVIAAYNINNSFFMVLASLCLMILLSLNLDFFRIFLVLTILHIIFTFYFLSRRRVFSL